MNYLPFDQNQRDEGSETYSREKISYSLNNEFPIEIGNGWRNAQCYSSKQDPQKYDVDYYELEHIASTIIEIPISTQKMVQFVLNWAVLSILKVCSKGRPTTDHKAIDNPKGKADKRSRNSSRRLYLFSCVGLSTGCIQIGYIVDVL